MKMEANLNRSFSGIFEDNENMLDSLFEKEKNGD